MEAMLGTTLPVFVGITVIVIGFASFMTGQALAGTWRPFWQLVPYVLLLGFVSRFLIWGLFEGELWHLSGYILDVLVLFAIGALAFRVTLARNMTTQYPWLYERTTPFSWREKA